LHRELVLEEFADFTAPAEPKGEGGGDSDEDRPAFKFDPVSPLMPSYIGFFSLDWMVISVACALPDRAEFRAAHPLRDCHVFV
jgi:hypothetical protein